MSLGSIALLDCIPPEGEIEIALPPAVSQRLPLLLKAIPSPTEPSFSWSQCEPETGDEEVSLRSEGLLTSMFSPATAATNRGSLVLRSGLELWHVVFDFGGREASVHSPNETRWCATSLILRFLAVHNFSLFPRPPVDTVLFPLHFGKLPSCQHLHNPPPFSPLFFHRSCLSTSRYKIRASTISLGSRPIRRRLYPVPRTSRGAGWPLLEPSSCRKAYVHFVSLAIPAPQDHNQPLVAAELISGNAEVSILVSLGATCARSSTQSAVSTHQHPAYPVPKLTRLCIRGELQALWS